MNRVCWFIWQFVLIVGLSLPVQADDLFDKYREIMTSFSIAQPQPMPQDTYEQKTMQVLRLIVKEQINKMEETANSTNSGHQHNIKGYVLSTHIRNFTDISGNTDQEIRQISEQIRLLIRKVAADIEVSGGSSGSLTVDQDGNIQYEANNELSKALNEKRKNLLKANLKNSVSVRSATMAIRLLVEVNDGLREQARDAVTRQEKERYYTKMILCVYEMADITLELINGVTLEGKETIDSLHDNAKQLVKRRSTDIDTQISRVRQIEDQGLMTPEQADKEVGNYILQRKADEQHLDAWMQLIFTMGNQQDFIDKLIKQTIVIEYTRDKAKVQLETLRDRELDESNEGTIRWLNDLVPSVADFDLLMLNEETVRNILGYDLVSYEPSTLD